MKQIIMTPYYRQLYVYQIRKIFAVDKIKQNELPLLMVFDFFIFIALSFSRVVSYGNVSRAV